MPFQVFSWENILYNKPRLSSDRDTSNAMPGVLLLGGYSIFFDSYITWFHLHMGLMNSVFRKIYADLPKVQTVINKSPDGAGTMC